MMKFRSTGLLLLVFVLLLGYVYFVELKKPAAVAPVDKSAWVLTLSQDDVQQLAVTYQGQSATYVKADGAWHMGALDGVEADATQVDSVVLSLVNLQATRVLTQSLEALSTYGLEKPPLTVTLGLANGGQDVLFFGDKNPTGTQYYVVHKGSDPVFLVYAALADDLRNLVLSPPYKPTPVPASPGTTTPAP